MAMRPASAVVYLVGSRFLPISGPLSGRICTQTVAAYHSVAVNTQTLCRPAAASAAGGGVRQLYPPADSPARALSVRTALLSGAGGGGSATGGARRGSQGGGAQCSGGGRHGPLIDEDNEAEKRQDPPSPTAAAAAAEEAKPSMLQRFKHMYKQYGYILVPVHLVTSSIWFGSFYYASKSGVDIAGVLSSCGVSDSITAKLGHSSAGHLAVAYALYKLATPARYTVTLGGTTYSIKWLSERGYIKPAPDSAEIRKMYVDRREKLREKVDELHVRRRLWRERFQERRKRGWSRRK